MGTRAEALTTAPRADVLSPDVGLGIARGYADRIKEALDKSSKYKPEIFRVLGTRRYQFGFTTDDNSQMVAVCEFGRKNTARIDIFTEREDTLLCSRIRINRGGEAKLRSFRQNTASGASMTIKNNGIVVKDLDTAVDSVLNHLVHLSPNGQNGSRDQKRD